MSPTPRLALLVALVGASALVLPAALVALEALVLAGAAVADALAVRRRAGVSRRVSAVLSRGVASPLELDADVPPGARTRLRQAAPAALAIRPPEDRGRLRAQLLPLRRGRHLLPPAALRVEGPLRLMARHRTGSRAEELTVLPDLPAARRLALAVRSGQFREEGRTSRGPLGLGTEFESVRDYLPDDDIRQVNWGATARLGRPMSNQYRLEQDRDLICVVDAGRLMAATLGDRSRLDAALDAVTAVALVADEAGDRCGALAFDTEILRHVRPRRRGSQAVVQALFDLEPSARDSDYELAFRAVGASKRSLVLVLCDLVEESASKPLLEAVPVLARRHHVVVASASDPYLELASGAPAGVTEAYSQAVAVDVVGARRRVARQLARTGAEVLEAPPAALGAACVRAYLRAKSRARL